MASTGVQVEALRNEEELGSRQKKNSHSSSSSIPKRPKRKTLTSSSSSSSTSPRKKPTKAVSSTTRTNWAVGAAKEQLERAVQEWDDQTGRALHPKTGQRLSLREYSLLINIPYHTFRKYVSTKERRVIGQTTGRQPLLPPEEQELVAEKLTARGEGVLAQEFVDAVMERHPELTRAQALRHINRTLLKHNRDQLQVPPKRVYNRKRKLPSQGNNAAEEENTETGGESKTDNNSDDNDSETNNPPPEEEEEARQEESAREATSDRQHTLAAIDAKIAKLRSDLLDAELERERLLRKVI